ncbi:glycosyltransferase family 8 protein [Thermophilibacter provencensis]|uniref:Glycosyltransferase family 8 protein n=1 Tax=Thermophilibacter provencensis TaxID=1852386 RepID=A0ABT7V5E2_9ACTN|nr:glycosyltransferase family 8 protein [Thermophilibacter provencensis]MDM8271817.1 glycosyltransferase family 8 protein [Thermophilibacter provencensis]
MKPLRKTTHVRNPLSSTMLASSSVDLDLPLSDVVIVFACSENFVPYLSVATQSIIENATADRRYDIIVLTRDISPASMITLTRQVKSENVGIGFLDVDAALGDIELPHHGHFRPETYFRLLAPQLLPNVDKAIYLDSDLIADADIAELFDVDVTGYPLAATRDADTIGQIEGYDTTVGPYLKNELGMSDPHDYFQAGVLLMNLAHLRATVTPDEFLELSTQRMWRWLDQDVLNKVVNGNYVRVHMRWNYLMDWQHLRRTHIIANAPADVRAEYEEAAEKPAIIHFAGPDNRPWLYPDADRADDFWRYAMHSPYLDEIRGQLEESRATAAGLAKRVQVIALYKGIMPAFDKVFPAGTRRRNAVIRTYMGLGGANL